MNDDALFEVVNSYFGLFRQAMSHHVRAQLANVARRHDFTVNGDLTKVYRRGASA